MKKSLFFKILYLFLVLIVIAGASVFATNTYLSARDVSYGSTNVEDALNGLFTLKGNDENYSTDEKVVGKWIDGKPVYRKIINGITPSKLNTNQYYEFTDENIINLLIKSDFIIDSNAYTAHSTYSDANDNVGVCVLYEKSNPKHIRLSVNNPAFTNKNVYFLLEYTKNID